MDDPIDFGKELSGIIRDALAPVSARLDELSAREAPRGEPGKDADPAAIAAMVKEAVEALPPARDGKDADPIGDEQIAAQVAKHLELNPVRDGRDADPVDLDALADAVVAKLLASDRIETLVELATAKAMGEYFAENPVQHGKDVDPALIDEMVTKAVSAIPAPRDGVDADPVSDEQIAAQVAKHLAAYPPKDGADGVGLAGAMIDRTGSLVVTKTNGEAINLGPVVGKDGLDGLSFESVSGQYDSERGFVLQLTAGDRKAEFVLPYMVHRGFWREGLGTKSGQSITHDGALWIAKRDNASKPCLENKDDWILAARKGRDGQEVKVYKPAPDHVRLGDSRG